MNITAAFLECFGIFSGNNGNNDNSNSDWAALLYALRAPLNTRVSPVIQATLAVSIAVVLLIILAGMLLELPQRASRFRTSVADLLRKMDLRVCYFMTADIVLL